MIIKNTLKTEVSCEEGKRFYLRIEESMSGYWPIWTLRRLFTAI